MNQKQLNIFVFCLFTLIITLVVLTRQNQTALRQDLLTCPDSSFTDLRFYKDAMRDGQGLDLPLKPEEKKEFIKAVKTVKESNVSLKSITYLKHCKITFNLAGKEDDRKIELHLILAKEYPDTLIASASIVSGAGYYNGGQLSSPELLKWLNKTAEQDYYSKIWIIR